MEHGKKALGEVSMMRFQWSSVLPRQTLLLPDFARCPIFLEVRKSGSPVGIMHVQPILCAARFWWRLDFPTFVLPGKSGSGQNRAADIQIQRHGFQTSAAFKLPNGYVLPEGKLTPNTLFVGGIDTKVDENEIRDFFARYGTVKEVKIITYRGGICKGYGFVYFNEDVDIQTIVEQQITFKGKKLKLGPAIMKERSSRSVTSPLIGPPQWISPSPYIYCSCCPAGLAVPSPVLNAANHYIPSYSYSTHPGVMVPQIPMSYAQTSYAYQYTPQWSGEQRARLVNQNCVDSGVQTLLTLL
ncbi:deleted in azoospermia-like [Chanos chanos]|uniref:Deleted in azoospermia-like n=1 Tax=Chanos chanos TaxID=29144 RepID=A0A6J2WLI0_CHACN|nr:deleted in azoospermia-like [Chanos chanos]